MAFVALASCCSAYAFHLDDHERVTLQAYDEFVKCFPQYEAQLNVRALVHGDLDEDTNLFEKELFYSHFYNPHKKLNMWRADSAGRIESLKPDLLQSRATLANWSIYELNELGHAIHHFQDMAVPAHVVPVNHSWWDGFESYVLRGDISSQWTCQEVASANVAELEEILKQTAEETEAAVQNYTVEALVKNSARTVTLTGKDFWVESPDDSFGAYGGIGNQFGTLEITDERGSMLISDDAYRSFKQQQMQLAVRATLRGMVWAFRPQLILKSLTEI